jgi:hypothetical protein
MNGDPISINEVAAALQRLRPFWPDTPGREPSAIIVQAAVELPAGDFRGILRERPSFACFLLNKAVVNWPPLAAICESALPQTCQCDLCRDTHHAGEPISSSTTASP